MRISSADLLGHIDIEAVGAALSAVTDATLQSSLAAVLREKFLQEAPTLSLALIGLGRLGGRELNYSSDADICFVYEPIDDSAKAGSDALAIISQLQQLLAAPANDPSLHIDMDLRPEGKQGAVARTLDSYAAYYQRWSLTWESQALLRARPIAGDMTLGVKFIELINPLRYPTGGLTPDALRDIRRIKARVEAERLPRGVDPALHVKLGPGAISDVEWTVQLIQLQEAARLAPMQNTATLATASRMAGLGLVTEDEAQRLRAAWILASEIRNGITLTQGVGSDSIPGQGLDLRLLAFARGGITGEQLIENYRRGARRARAVMQRYVYGEDLAAE